MRTDEEDDDKIDKKQQLREEKLELFKDRFDEKEMRSKIEENRINLKILKLQKEDEEQKAYEDYRNEGENKDHLSEIDDEQDWDWYNPEDDNIYFIVTTGSQ